MNHERRRETLLAAVTYSALAILFTWPLARGLARDIPGDFGDPLLNAWILAWDASHLDRGWWNANIFHPHPLALAYSEHLLPQALTILPVQLLVNNPILSYNLLFLSTFVLSGLGMFLFVRALTGSGTAAFVAGAAYAFAPYRVTSIPHLQILSSQWLPFALYGFRKYFDSVRSWGPALAGPSTATGASAGPEGPPKGGRPATAIPGRRRTIALVGAAGAWLVQNLSCGYYLLFFSPVVLAYLVWEMTTRGLWRNGRIVAVLAAACAVVLGVTATVMLPYFELRALGFNPRSLEETTKFSADVYAYLTADPNLRLWGWLQTWPKAEGALFPGLTVTGLAAVAMWNAVLRIRHGRTKFLIPNLAFFISSLAVLAALLLGWSIRLPVLKVTSFSRALIVIAAAWAAALTVSPRMRRGVAACLATPTSFFTLVAIFAIVMSWGPSIVAKGRTVADSNLYALFYDWVPGFDGVRVPARFAMVLTFALAVLGGLGVAVLERRGRALVAAAATALLLLEGIAVPIPINQNAIDYQRPGLAPLPGTVADVPAVYGFVSTLPETAVIVELPLGEPAFDVRYMLYSTKHWRRLVNGYSGGAPKDYERLDQSLQDVLTRPDPAWDALMATRPTHAIVHEAFYDGTRGARVSDWVRSHGAQELAVFGTDRIFRLP